MNEGQFFLFQKTQKDTNFNEYVSVIFRFVHAFEVGLLLSHPFRLNKGGGVKPVDETNSLPVENERPYEYQSTPKQAEGNTLAAPNHQGGWVLNGLEMTN